MIAFHETPPIIGRSRFSLENGFEETRADLVSIDPDQLAAAISQSRGGQQQEEFLEIETCHRTIDLQQDAALGNIQHGAVAAPGAVDSHDVNANPFSEIDSGALSEFSAHCHLLIEVQHIETDLQVKRSTNVT
jgi:hypothetical protein